MKKGSTENRGEVPEVKKTVGRPRKNKEKIDEIKDILKDTQDIINEIKNNIIEIKEVEVHVRVKKPLGRPKKNKNDTEEHIKEIPKKKVVEKKVVEKKVVEKKIVEKLGTKKENIHSKNSKYEETKREVEKFINTGRGRGFISSANYVKNSLCKKTTNSPNCVVASAEQFYSILGKNFEINIIREVIIENGILEQYKKAIKGSVFKELGIYTMTGVVYVKAFRTKKEYKSYESFYGGSNNNLNMG